MQIFWNHKTERVVGWVFQEWHFSMVLEKLQWMLWTLCLQFVSCIFFIKQVLAFTVEHESHRISPNSGQKDTLIKKKMKFSSYIRKFRMEQLQSHLWPTASSYMGKYLRISSYIRKPFLIYDNDFATAPLWISLYMKKVWFSFCISVLFELL